MADTPMIPDATTLDSFRKGEDGAARIAAATKDVRNVCGWHVAPSRTETIKVRPGPRGSIFLPSLHVTAVTAIRDPDGDLVDPSQYVWSESGVIVLITGWWRPAVYEVDVTHGYPEVPEDLRDVILARAARATDDPTGRIAQIGRGPFSEQYNTGGVSGFDPERERAIVKRYRIPRSR